MRWSLPSKPALSLSLPRVCFARGFFCHTFGGRFPLTLCPWCAILWVSFGSVLVGALPRGESAVSAPPVCFATVRAHNVCSFVEVPVLSIGPGGVVLDLSPSHYGGVLAASVVVPWHLVDAFTRFPVCPVCGVAAAVVEQDGGAVVCRSCVGARVPGVCSCCGEEPASVGSECLYCASGCPVCSSCGEPFDPARALLACPSCGEGSFRLSGCTCCGGPVPAGSLWCAACQSDLLVGGGGL